MNTNPPSPVPNNTATPQPNTPQAAPPNPSAPPSPAPKKRRLRSDSTWAKMRPEHRGIISHWLYKEGMSYRSVIYHAKNDLEVKLTLAAVCRFYHQGLRMQSVLELADAQEAAQEIQDSPGDIDVLRKSAMKMVHVRFLQKSMASADVQELAVLARVVGQAEEREIKKQRVKLARDKFEFNAARAAMKAAPLANKFKEEDIKREEQRMEEYARKLFGSEWDHLILPAPGAVPQKYPKIT